jgi:hypothetical protein
MPLPLPSAGRVLKHTRAIDLAGYRRDDGLWEIEGRITDVKPFDVNWARRLPAGVPQHDMLVRLIIDTEFNIRDVAVVSDANPYGPYCEAVVPDYRQLIGLNLARGFRKTVRELFAGVKGCTHITELLGVMPTAAIQCVTADETRQATQDGGHFAFDRCAALDRRGGAVREYYPQWYIGGEKNRA